MTPPAQAEQIARHWRRRGLLGVTMLLVIAAIAVTLGLTVDGLFERPAPDPGAAQIVGVILGAVLVVGGLVWAIRTRSWRSLRRSVVLVLPSTQQRRDARRDSA